MSDLNRQSDSTDSQTLEARTRAALRASAENLDGHTRSKLTQARFAALAAAKERPAFWQMAIERWWVPAGAATAAAILAVALSFNYSRIDPEAHHSGSVFEDLEIVASDDSLELYRDMDFYSWLNSEQSEDWTPSDGHDDSDSKAIT